MLINYCLTNAILYLTLQKDFVQTEVQIESLEIPQRLQSHSDYLRTNYVFGNWWHLLEEVLEHSSRGKSIIFIK